MVRNLIFFPSLYAGHAFGNPFYCFQTFVHAQCLTAVLTAPPQKCATTLLQKCVAGIPDSFSRRELGYRLSRIKTFELAKKYNATLYENN